jgi:hypothetical protein
MSWNEADIIRARRVMLEAAQGMLAGRLSYIEGARKIIAARSAARLDESDPDLLPFIAIDSETDALPFGEMRSHWQPAALEALQPTIDQSEAWAQRAGEPHCRNLVARFATGKFTPAVGPGRSLIGTDGVCPRED